MRPTSTTADSASRIDLAGTPKSGNPYPLIPPLHGEVAPPPDDPAPRKRKPTRPIALRGTTWPERRHFLGGDKSVELAALREGGCEVRNRDGQIP